MRKTSLKMKSVSLLLCLTLAAGLLPSAALAADTDVLSRLRSAASGAAADAADLRGRLDADGLEIGDGIPDADEYFLNFDLGDGRFNNLHSFVLAVEKAHADRETTRQDLLKLADTLAAGIKNDSELFDGWDVDLSKLKIDSDITIHARYKKSGTTSGGGTSAGTATTISDDDTPTADAPTLDKTDHSAYLSGYPDGTVRPTGNVTRAEVATIFYRLLSDTARSKYASKTNSYADVFPDAWYNDAVSTLSNAGIISGYPNGTFQPDGEITRAELTSIVMRFCSSTGAGTGSDAFTDISACWARQSINDAAALGVVHGYADGSFRPAALVTRAETATIVNNELGRSPENSGLSAGMKTWKDNADPAAWYYAAIQEATNTHQYSVGASGEVWTSVAGN